jgi:hypothetical protein
VLLSVVGSGRNGAKIAQRKKSETFLCHFNLYFQYKMVVPIMGDRKIQPQTNVSLARSRLPAQCRVAFKQGVSCSAAAGRSAFSGGFTRIRLGRGCSGVVSAAARRDGCSGTASLELEAF